jgi:hypothetical protein
VIYDALTHGADDFSHDSTITSNVVFTVLVVVGSGLLIFNALFERAAIAVALAVVIWLAAFVATYAFVADGGQLLFSTRGTSATIDASQLCDGPLVVAIVAVVLAACFAGCIVAAVERCPAQWRVRLPLLLKFVVGFAVGALGMLILFQALEGTSASLTQQHDCGWLVTFVVLAVFVAIGLGTASIYVFEYVDIILRCVTGGHALACACSRARPRASCELLGWWCDEAARIRG